jgi:hypothetical protein
MADCDVLAQPVKPSKPRTVADIVDEAREGVDAKQVGAHVARQKAQRDRKILASVLIKRGRGHPVQRLACGIPGRHHGPHDVAEGIVALSLERVIVLVRRTKFHALAIAHYVVGTRCNAVFFAQS